VNSNQLELIAPSAGTKVGPTVPSAEEIIRRYPRPRACRRARKWPRRHLRGCSLYLMPAAALARTFASLALRSSSGRGRQSWPSSSSRSKA
jgi:hypothetical protein